MWEGNKRLTPSCNQSLLFPPINQLFSTPQVPHFPPFPNPFHSCSAVHELRCIFWPSQIFSSYFTICYILSHLIKVKEKTKNSQTYNELFSSCCCHIGSDAITEILNQSHPAEYGCKNLAMVRAGLLAYLSASAVATPELKLTLNWTSSFRQSCYI